MCIRDRNTFTVNCCAEFAPITTWGGKIDSQAGCEVADVTVKGAFVLLVMLTNLTSCALATMVEITAVVSALIAPPVPVQLAPPSVIVTATVADPYPVPLTVNWPTDVPFGSNAACVILMLTTTTKSVCGAELTERLSQLTLLVIEKAADMPLLVLTRNVWADGFTDIAVIPQKLRLVGEVVNVLVGAAAVSKQPNASTAMAAITGRRDRVFMLALFMISIHNPLANQQTFHPFMQF